MSEYTSIPVRPRDPTPGRIYSDSLSMESGEKITPQEYNVAMDEIDSFSEYVESLFLNFGNSHDETSAIIMSCAHEISEIPAGDTGSPAQNLFNHYKRAYLGLPLMLSAQVHIEKNNHLDPKTRVGLYLRAAGWQRDASWSLLSSFASKRQPKKPLFTQLHHIFHKYYANVANNPSKGTAESRMAWSGVYGAARVAQHLSESGYSVDFAPNNWDAGYMIDLIVKSKFDKGIKPTYYFVQIKGNTFNESQFAIHGRSGEGLVVCDFKKLDDPTNITPPAERAASVRMGEGIRKIKQLVPGWNEVNIVPAICYVSYPQDALNSSEIITPTFYDEHLLRNIGTGAQYVN